MRREGKEEKKRQPEAIVICVFVTTKGTGQVVVAGLSDGQ